MAGKVKVEITGENLRAINELLCSSGVQQHMLKAAQYVAQSASGIAENGGSFGSKVELTTRKWLCVANVWPDSAEAAHDNYNDNVLQKALDSSGLYKSKRRSR